MAEYLHFTCGPYHFLLNAEMVSDVVSIPCLAPLKGANDFPVLPLRQAINLPAQPPGGTLTYASPGGARMVLAVDQIIGREMIPDSYFQPPPSLPQGPAMLTDAALAGGADGKPILRCRHPLPLSCPAKSRPAPSQWS